MENAILSNTFNLKVAFEADDDRKVDTLVNLCALLKNSLRAVNSKLRRENISPRLLELPRLPLNVREVNA